MNKTATCLVLSLTSSADQVADAFYQAGHGNLTIFTKTFNFFCGFQHLIVPFHSIPFLVTSDIKKIFQLDLKYLQW